MSIIRNHRQYARVRAEFFRSRAQRDRLSRNLDRSKRRSADEIEIQQLETSIGRLKSMLLEYKALLSGEAEFPDLDGADNPGLNLIRARVAIGWTLGEFAALCNLKPQQIHRYESTHYASAKLSRLIAIVNVFRREMPGYIGKSGGRSKAGTTEESAAEESAAENDSAGPVEFS